MDLKDLILTPIFLILLMVLAYLIRPLLTNKKTKKFFIPALLVRFVGAIAVGVIYQFYYGFGGDTMNFYRQAGVVYEALTTNVTVGIKLFIGSNSLPDPEVFEYSSRIYWYRSSTEFILIKIIALIDLLTFRTYSATALFFASFSFLGSWMMFRVFQSRFPSITNTLAYSVLFIPSCIFWGSGILKDTITLGALGLLIWSSNKIIYNKKLRPLTLLVSIFSIWLLYSIKIYILLCLIPALFIWWYLENTHRVKSFALRILVIPLFAIPIIFMGYYTLSVVAETSDKYNLDAIARRAYITSYDIRYYSGSEAGSGYDIGVQDGSFNTMLKLLPAAINVSLFRPYPWEVRNPLMILSTIEAMVFFYLTVRVIFSLKKQNQRKNLGNPMVRMCIIFSLAFAFAVGVSTYNFGSLSRYKIPLLPFYATAMVIILTPRDLSKAVHR